MKKIVFRTNPSYIRPFIKLEHTYNALIDTGADMPVCYLDKEILTSAPLNAKPILSDQQIKAVGRKKVKGDVYVIPLFVMGDLMYPYLPVFVPDISESDDEDEGITHFIIAASMLHGLCYEYDTPNNAFTITVPDGEDLVRHPKIIIDGEPVVFEETATQ